MKMKILPRLLIIFQSLIIKIPQGLLITIQRIINKFVWKGQKDRIKMLTMQLSTEQGGVPLPDVLLYNHAAVLMACVEWWNLINKDAW